MSRSHCLPLLLLSVFAGADRLFTEYAHLIRGKKLALVSNHSGRLADGTHLADALHRRLRAGSKVSDVRSPGAVCRWTPNGPFPVTPVNLTGSSP